MYFDRKTNELKGKAQNTRLIEIMNTCSFYCSIVSGKQQLDEYVDMSSSKNDGSGTIKSDRDLGALPKNEGSSLTLKNT